jgi:Mrp family chromosome partitioning ATPase
MTGFLRSRSSQVKRSQSSPYDQLLYTVFQEPVRKKGQGMVVAVTSAHPRAGVSWITAALVHELAKFDSTSVARINSKSLRKLCDPATVQRALSQPASNVCDLSSSDAPFGALDQSGRWEGSRQHRHDCISLLRAEFDYSIIDCPSLKDAGDLLSIAPFVDGVLLVVEANVTRREQVQHAERAIESARGKLLGHVLNKRTYEIPGWLYETL